MDPEDNIFSYRRLVLPYEAGAHVEECFRHIDSVIKTYLTEIHEILEEGQEKRITLYIPMLARGLIEATCLGLSGRLDPTRLLVLKGIQSSADYKIGSAHKAAYKWQGDVLAERVDNLWAEKNAVSPVRALLGDYYDHLYWRRAYTLMVDKTTSIRSGEWLSRLKALGESGFCPSVRSELSKAYSIFSKGIHCEFVAPCGETYDAETVRVSMVSTLSVLAGLAFVSNFILDLMPLSVVESCGDFELVEALEEVWLPV